MYILLFCVLSIILILLFCKSFFILILLEGNCDCSYDDVNIRYYNTVGCLYIASYVAIVTKIVELEI